MVQPPPDYGQDSGHGAGVIAATQLQPLVRFVPMWPSHPIAHSELDWVIDESDFPINRGRPDEREVTEFTTWHRQRWVWHPDDTGTLVDTGIARVIGALWRAGVDTAFSCERLPKAWRYVTCLRDAAGISLTRRLQSNSTRCSACPRASRGQDGHR